MKRASLEHEHSSDGSLTYLRVNGVVDESFQGESSAASVKSKNIIINCAGISLITSYGLRSWSNFLKVFEQGRGQITFVEVSSVFVGEMNQVVDFTANGHVLSCYGQYLCHECGANRSILLRTDLDAESIANRQAPELSCLACGGALEFDEDPATYYPALLAHTKRPIDAGVLSFLGGRLGYETDSNRHLRIQKDISGDTTVLLLSGNLDESLNAQKLSQGLQGDVVVDLSGIMHVHQQGIQVWREFLDEAIQRTENLWLLGSPALVIERAFDGLSQQSGLHVVSARIPYHCHSCDGTEFVLLDLSGKDGQVIRGGAAPVRACSSCKKPVKAMIGAKVVQQLAELPEPKLPRTATRAIQTVKKKLEKATKEPAAEKVRQGQAWPVAALVLVLLIVAGGAALIITSRSGENTVAAKTGNTTTDKPAVVRPDWIVSDIPSSSYCVDLGWQLQCVGVSSYHSTAEAAEADGLEGAIEALVHAALLNEAAVPVASQRQAYLKTRTVATQTLEQATQKGDKALRKAALTTIRTARSQVVELAKGNAAAGTPTRRADWHWEEYVASGGNKTEFLAFVRVDASTAELTALSRYFSTSSKVGGAQLSPMIPTMGWLFATDGMAGFLVSGMEDGAIQENNIQEGDILLVPTTVADAPKLETALLEQIEAGKVVVRRGATYEDVKKTP